MLFFVSLRVQRNLKEKKHQRSRTPESVDERFPGPWEEKPEPAQAPWEGRTGFLGQAALRGRGGQAGLVLGGQGRGRLPGERRSTDCAPKPWVSGWLAARREKTMWDSS